MILSITANPDIPIDNSLRQLEAIKFPIDKNYYQPHTYFIYSDVWHEYNHPSLLIPNISITNNTILSDLFDEIYDVDIYNTFVKATPTKRVKIKARIKSIQYKKALALPVEEYLL